MSLVCKKPDCLVRKDEDMRRRTMTVTKAFVLVLALGGPVSSNAGTLGVCPQGAEGDRPFKMSNLSKCMWVTNDHLKRPEAFKKVDYNIYCPGRMSQAVASRVGQEIVNGARIRNQAQQLVNPVVSQHGSALVPKFDSVPHRFEYACFLGLQRAVATHIKLRVKALPKEVVGRRNCSFFGSQNGDIALNARADREYKCNPMFHNSQRGDVVWDEAKRLVERDFLSELRAIGGKACILHGGAFGSENTDIQCAPCTYSDKLIVRLKTVPVAQACPSNTVRTVLPSGGRSSCSASVQGRIAWNYSGSTSWNPTNVQRLCRGAEDSPEPARCFDRVMHSGVNWGGSTRWLWQNAIDLCEGTRNASKTIACFKARIASGSHWVAAIAACDR